MEAQNMPRDIFTRIVRGDMNNPSIRQATEWLARIAAASHFDPEVLLYPTTSLVQAYEKATGKPILYMPVSTCYMMESLGPNPDASETEIAAALAQITKTLVWEGQNKGIGEFYMPCSDGNVIRLAELHGFQRMTYAERRESDVIPEKATVDNPAPEPVKQVEVTLRDMPFLKMKTYR